jgi:hypothetical protein
MIFYPAPGFHAESPWWKGSPSVAQKQEQRRKKLQPTQATLSLPQEASPQVRCQEFIDRNCSIEPWRARSGAGDRMDSTS